MFANLQMSKMTKRGTETRDQIVRALLGAALGAAAGRQGAMAGGLVGLFMGQMQSTTSEGAKPDRVEHEPEGLRLKEVAQQSHVTPATAYAHLQRLEEAGKAKRIDAHDGPRYVARYGFQAELIDPEAGVHERWRSTVPIDWRFPLVSRVPDAEAAHFLYRWLDAAAERDLLPCLQAYRTRQEVPFVSILVYGSCARGDAREGSDIDILLWCPDGWDGAEALMDLAHEVGLDGSRSPDIRVLTNKDRSDIEPRFWRNAVGAGRTVWTNVAAPVLMEHVHGVEND